LALTAKGLLDAARLLDGRYHLVVTNVPYLARGKQIYPQCSSHPNGKANFFKGLDSEYKPHFLPRRSVYLISQYARKALKLEMTTNGSADFLNRTICPAGNSCNPLVR
jgi:hypothetical protein